MENKSRVSLTKIHSQALTFEVEQKLAASIDNLGVLKSFEEKGKRVLIKPNIASPGGLFSTNPSVTYAAAKIFVDAGFDVWIGENPSIPTDAKAAYEEYGLYDLAERAGAEVVDLRRGPHVTVDVPGGELFEKLEVSKYAVDADILISVAVMKSANIVTATLGIKNMKGVIPSKWKRNFHCEGLNRGIADLMRVVKPDLSIIDCTFGKDMTEGRCYPVGLIIASEDPLAADAVCSRIMGFDPNEIEHLKLVGRAGLGRIKKEEIDIEGESIADYEGKFPFSKPKDPFTIADESNGRIKITQGNPCSVCLNELGTVLYLYQDKVSELNDLTILIGPEAAPESSDERRVVIGYGNCVSEKKCQYHITGCPPTDYREAETGSLIDVMEQILHPRGEV